MGKKRKHSSITATSALGGSETYRERQGYDVKLRTDPVTGQQGAFPGLEDEPTGAEGGDGSDGLFYGPAEDGIAYLKMVRAEAADIPSMLQATQQQYQSPVFDGTAAEQTLRTDNTIRARSFWHGDAVIADVDSEDDEDVYSVSLESSPQIISADPQEAFYQALLARFASLRSSLQACATSHRLPAMTVQSKTHLDPSPVSSTTASQNSWYRAFSYSKPTTQFVSKLPHSAVMLALERLELLLRKRGSFRDSQRRTNIGAWAWCLLAICREVGQLNGEEVASMRTLAKTALAMERKLRRTSALQSQMPANEIRMDTMSTSIGPETLEDTLSEASEDFGEHEDEAVDDEEEEGEVTEETDRHIMLEEAKARLLSSLNSETARGEHETGPSLTTSIPSLMMLDSIVTIVGSNFGQTDLLGERPVW